jgi:hypothetical protein
MVKSIIDLEERLGSDNPGLMKTFWEVMMAKKVCILARTNALDVSRGWNNVKADTDRWSLVGVFESLEDAIKYALPYKDNYFLSVFGWVELNKGYAVDKPDKPDFAFHLFGLTEEEIWQKVKEVLNG